MPGKKGVPITEAPDLVAALMKLDLQEQIPEELYKVAVEILALAYRLNRKVMEGN